MKLPRWSDLIGTQRDVFQYPTNKPLFVVGPPGSGKTVLAIQRAQQVTNDSQNATIVTFNRMLRRLVSSASDEAVTASTMHSFLRSYCRQYTGNEQPPCLYGNIHCIDWRALEQILSTLKGNTIYVDHLVIDEGQDLNKDFFQLAQQYATSTLTVFADDDQAWKNNSVRTTIEEIQRAGNLPDPIMLTENHRNTPEVAKVAEHFHSGRLPAASVRRPSVSSQPRLLYSPDELTTVQRIGQWFKNRGGQVGVVVDRNETGERIQAALQKLVSTTAVQRYDSKLQNEADIDLDGPGITILNCKSVKGQEFDTVFVLELEEFLPPNNNPEHPQRRVMYMLCSRARDHLWLVYGPGRLSPQTEAILPNHDLLARR